eukprot:gene34532-57321_t
MMCGEYKIGLQRARCFPGSLFHSRKPCRGPPCTKTSLPRSWPPTTPAKGSVTEPVKAGFVYVSPITEAGWTRQHDEGRKAVEAALGNQVKTTF